MIRLDYMKENSLQRLDAEFWFGKGCQNEDFPDCIGLINTDSNSYKSFKFP